MLKIYNPVNESDVIPLQLEDGKRYITHKWDGNDILTFEIESNNPVYKNIVEETKIEDENNRYIVKKIDEHSDFVTVNCYIDLDDWKANLIKNFRTTNKMLLEVLQDILPEDWLIIGGGTFTDRRTIEESEGTAFELVTPIELLPKISEVYGCTFNFNSINKTIEVIDYKSFSPSGKYFSDELNLESIGFVGDSSNFATRLYAYGKKDDSGNALTFASINGGKEYVEDYSYSNKIISVGWSDERYTVKENLLEDAKAKLKELAFPVRSYTCETSKLGDGIWMYQVVTLIDRKRKTRVNHQVIEYKEYPNHVNDSITLSAVSPKIESYVSKVEESIKNKIKKSESLIQKEIDKAFKYATEQITGNNGGSFMWVYDSEGKPIELLNLGDTEDIATAQKIWRWNASGLGHSNNGYNGDYTLAFLSDGSVNASAITTGVLTANIIRAGKLTDLQGLNYWDLETGEFKLTANAKVEDKTLEEYAQSGFESLTQEQIFNKLTNNGQTMGIYLDSKTNSLYLNASYMKTGKLQGVEIVAESGKIGGFEITQDKLYGGTSSGSYVGLSPSSDGYAFWAGASSINSISEAPFRVLSNGKFYAANAVLTGSFVSNVGDYGQISIDRGRIDFGSDTSEYGDIYCSNSNPYSGNDYKGLVIRADSLLFGCKEAFFSNGITKTISFLAPTSMNSDGTAASWKSVKLAIQGGILTNDSY